MYVYCYVPLLVNPIVRGGEYLNARGANSGGANPVNHQRNDSRPNRRSRCAQDKLRLKPIMAETKCAQKNITFQNFADSQGQKIFKARDSAR